MADEDGIKHWKLKLRYGQLTTPYQHFTAIAEGEVTRPADGFSCSAGPAFMGMKMWASSIDESGDMVQAIGRNIGFLITGRIQIYRTEPTSPPAERPYGYDINFKRFRADGD
jgi:hypothetical protein